MSAEWFHFSALTERVVEVLPQLNCPYSIEPHQIQGLDFINIFPVVQWLVKQAVEAKEKHGDSVKNHALYQFNTRCCSNQGNVSDSFSQGEYFCMDKGLLYLSEKKLTVTDEARNSEKFANSYRKIKAMCAPKRIYRRAENFVCENLREDVQCTLMEYGWKAYGRPKQTDLAEESEDQHVQKSAEKEVTERLQEQLAKSDDLPRKQRVSARTLVQLIDTESLRDATANAEEILSLSQVAKDEDAVTQLSNAELELETAIDDEKHLEEEIVHSKAENEKLVKEVAHYESRLRTFGATEGTTDTNELMRLKQLLATYDEVKGRESRFKADCKHELQKMDKELERLRSLKVLASEQKDIEIQKEEYAKALSLSNKVRLEDAELNRQTVMAQRRLDSVPSQIEISQYQRRMIELYNQMATKNRETKQLYSLYNTLIDIRSCVSREIDLMNNIEDVQEMALKESYKQSFLENLQTISKGIENSYDKVLTKRKELERTRDGLRGEYQYLLEKERLYHKTVDDFKEECQKNEVLRKKLNDNGLEIDGQF